MNAGHTGDRELRALIVDDTLVYRMILKEALGRLPGITVVGQAENGKVGLEKVRELSPDLILLDIEMPVMNGLEMFDVLRREHPQIKVMVVSSISRHSSKVTLEALGRGAIDFIGKPVSESAEASRAALYRELESKLRPVIEGARHDGRPRTPRPAALPAKPAGGGTERPARHAPEDAISAVRHRRPDVIAIGISTGGPQALSSILPALPANMPPIVLVQHMPALFLSTLAEKLDQLCALRVVEAGNGELLEPGKVYIAPGGIQMTLERQGTRGRIGLHDAPSENHCKPSADYLMRGVAETLGSRALGIIMTGMGDDGARGLLTMRQAGALTLAQDEASCTVYGMPKQALAAGAVDFVLSLDQLRDSLMAAQR